DHQVVVIRLGIFQPVFGRQHTVHRIAFRLQAALEDVIELLFVLDDEDAHSGYLSRLLPINSHSLRTSWDHTSPFLTRAKPVKSIALMPCVPPDSRAR